MINQLRSLLLTGPKPAKDLYHALGISQSSFSNLINNHKSEIIVLGQRRNTRYALIRPVRNLPKQLPIYLVRPDGTARLYGSMIAVYPKGFYIQPADLSITAKLYDDLPFWFSDLIPSGFLGRLIPKRHPELLYPDDIKLWSSDDCVHYWYVLGRDLIGNIIIGDHSLNIFNLAKKNISEIVSVSDKIGLYDRLVDELISFGNAGSSAGGEQPKFLTDIEENGNEKSVLVKFSLKSKDVLAVRSSDLLVCEQIALQTLNAHGYEAANACLIESDKRIYLEITRFDRVAGGGRRGVLALSAINHEYSGATGSWIKIARDLLDKSVISPDIFDEICIRYYFGILINNNDMHQGNLSFYVDADRIETLAPVYDMLPMGYFPVAGELPMPAVKPLALAPQDREYWTKAMKIADDFWNKVIDSEKISGEFKQSVKIFAEFSKQQH